FNKPTLGDAAAKNTGTAAGTVAAGDHGHAAGAITEDATHRFATDTEKNAWDAKLAGHVIQHEGTPVTQRDNINFIGGVQLQDDGGTGTTLVNVFGKNIE